MSSKMLSDEEIMLTGKVFENETDEPIHIGEAAIRFLALMKKEIAWLSNPKKHRLGGDSDWYQNVYLKSRHWKNKRASILNRRGHKCEKCRRFNFDAEDLAIHHKTYERLGFELDNDLEVLCHRCHSKIHNSQS